MAAWKEGRRHKLVGKRTQLLVIGIPNDKMLKLCTDADEHLAVWWLLAAKVQLLPPAKCVQGKDQNW